MKKNHLSLIAKLMLPIFILFCSNAGAWAASEVHVEKAGTLSSLLTTSESTLKITGVINGTDIKYLRELIKAGTVTDLDISGARIVKGGSAYVDSYTTADDVIGESMFKDCSKLKSIELPPTITGISSNAFVRSGLRKINIPDGVSRIGNDAFAYCSSLDTVVLGRRVTSMGQGVFYSSSVKMAYVKPTTPPNVPAYLFSGTPKICVYTNIVDAYKASDWSIWWTIVGGLEEIYPQEEDQAAIVNKLRDKYFEDAACTQLKAEYLAMSDSALAAAFAEGGMPEFMTEIALKLKNNNWNTYEKDFRIHSYKAYSDAKYWNEKMKSSGGSYMGNPTGIYAGGLESLYVFVDSDIPEDATLYLAGIVDRDLISNAKTGKSLSKGLNIIDGVKDALYYVLYTADTRSQTKKLSEWPEIKIHIQGGVVNGYYDVARKSDKDYTALLNAATHKYFTVKSQNAIFNFERSAYKEVWPRTIDRSIEWFDSLTVWQQELMGYRESVASGKRNCEPFFLTGGEDIAPTYYNNPNFAIQGDQNDGGYANSSSYRTCYNSVECIRNSFDVSRFDMDEWCAGHECGHNNQATINLEGGAEVSNNFFSNTCRYFLGRTTSGGDPLAVTMREYANHETFAVRGSSMRMYYQLFLYYHQARKNTSFFPNLFKALREDPLKIYNPNSVYGRESMMKFVRKACEVAQEDLTDFFTAWGFFEPVKNLSINLYGQYTMTVSQGNIDNTLKEISKYPKNRSILFIEDRVDYVLTNGLFSTPGQKRRESDLVGKCGDLGQFTDYLPGAATEPSSYTYIQSDSMYSMMGTGGVGFLALDKDSNFVYAANTLNFTIPSSIGTDFKLYSVDADGTLHEATKAADGTEYITMEKVGTLKDSLTTMAIKAVISGPINGTDIKYMRTLINENSLTSIDIANATIKAGGIYYGTYKSIANGIGNSAFIDCLNLTSITLPKGISKIETNAFTRSGLTGIVIPNSVTTIDSDAFAYCKNLNTVFIGPNTKNFSQGVFYSSDVKDVYIYATTPPSTPAYLFSSNPKIHVLAKSLSAYKASSWAQYGTIVGDLDNYTSIEQPNAEVEGYDANAPVYDLMGRKVTDLIPGVIYIRGGKKFIAKP